MNAAEQLRPRWRKAWRCVSGGSDPGVYAELLARYAEPHRAWHNLDHVAGCLRDLDVARSLLARPAEAELAVWFHNAIYDPRRNDNEAQSAALVEAALRAAGVGEETARRVGDLVRATAHRAPPYGDAAVVCDIDLAILGAEPDAFARYDAAIQQEYDWVPADVYRRERANVLSGFLERPVIYHTAFFHDRLETAARGNLRQAVAYYSV